jgi:hypothetical protein
MFQKEERGIAKLKEEIEKAKMKADRKKTVDWLNDVLQHRKNFREFHEKVNPNPLSFSPHCCFLKPLLQLGDEYRGKCLSLKFVHPFS